MVAKRRAVLVEERARQAIEEYKKSFAFDDEMTETGIVSYQMDFTNYLDKVIRLYYDLDLLGIIIAEEEEEGSSG